MSIARLAAGGLLLSVGMSLPGPGDARPGAEDRRAESVPATLHEIQGSGLVSPLAGTEVVVEGIVTAKTDFGYFLQSPDDATDGRPETSEALFVQRGGIDIHRTYPGDRVMVYGRVEEVLPGDDPHQLTVTQLVEVTNEFVLEQGLPLPAPILLTPDDLSAGADPTALERLEGMRVHADALVVVGPSPATINAGDQSVTKSGVFEAMLGTYLSGDARPFRQPGLPPFTAEPLPAGKSLPFHDGNPQVLAIDGNSQRGDTDHDFDVGFNDRIRNVVGVLDYWRRYRVLVDPAAPVTVETSVRGAGAYFLDPGEVKLLWMDLDGLYDASDDPTRDEPVPAPAVYQARLAKIARGLCQLIANPEIIAVGGVENVQVLRDLAALAETNPTTFCPWPRQYEAVLVEGSDASGLDLGFLVAGYLVDGVSPRVRVQAVETIAAGETSPNPIGPADPLFAQPPLAVRLQVTDEQGRQAGFTAVNLRLKEAGWADSLLPDYAGWSTYGERIMTLRARQAARIASWIEQRQQADPDEAIALLGGFEADAFNDGRVDVMGIVTGRPAPADQTWVAMPSPVTTPLANLTLLAPAYERYSANDNGEFRALDHIVLNQAMRRRFAIAPAHPRMNADFPASARAAGDPGITFGARDPLMARLAVAAFIDANTRVEIFSSDTISPRVDNIVYVSVVNRGPDAARSLELEIESSLAPAQWSLATDWPGWACGAVEAAPGGSRVRCTNDRLEDSQYFEIRVPADPSLDGGSATFTARLSGAHNDPDTSNNTFTRVVEFDGSVDLSVGLMPINGEQDLFPGESGGWVVVVERTPLNPPGPVAITLDIDAAASEVTLNLSNGYVTCDAGTELAPRRSRFACTAVNDDALQVAVFGLSFSTGLTDGGRVIGLRAEVAAGGSDVTPEDNVATASRRVSDRTDLRVSAPSPSADPAPLDGESSVSFVVSNALRGVARNARLELFIDLPPSALGELEENVFGYTPAIWNCLPPQADGAGSRILCGAIAPMLQPEFPSYSYFFQLGFIPPVRAGEAQYTVTTRVTVASDSEEQVPADNSAQGSLAVDQTTDLGIGFSAPLLGVAEPAQAVFPLQVQSFGPNLPRNARAELRFDSALVPADFTVTDDYGMAVACTLGPAVADGTLLQCPVAPGSQALRVAVRTHPELARKGSLALEATVINDLVDAAPANNTVNGVVSVLAEADLCIGRDCVPSPRPHPVRLEPDQPNTLDFDVANLGPSTTRNAVAIVDVLMKASRVSAAFNGQACEPAEIVGTSESRVRCPLGDLPGDGARGTLSLGLDTTGFPAGGETFLRIRLQGDVYDPRALNSELGLVLPIAPIVDLSAAVVAKRAQFPAPAVFSITAAAHGPATMAMSQLVIRIESPGAGDYANLVMDGPGWMCSPDNYVPDLQVWVCDRYLPIASGSPSVIGVEVPAHRFIQSGRPIRVTATHRYPPDALAVDRNPGNDSATAVHLVDGRKTRSQPPTTQPTPAYGKRRAAPAPAPRAPGVRTQVR